MGTKNNPGKFDCYDAADDDEPMFVLLARDPLAPLLVQLWANMRELTESTHADTDKIAEAFGCAADMETWRTEKGG